MIPILSDETIGKNCISLLFLERRLKHTSDCWKITKRKNDIDTCIELEGILLLDTCIDSAPNVLIAVHDRDRSKVARKVSALKPPLTRGPKKKEEREKRL